ncbi:hypothetical protein ECANGB1_738 [Enterospora canceri]|uniref:Uncharacterized protein n=1 Tax=Enterospora canceri TaxID=1081671 RepID=A0A1Y1S8B8_9MICR|nr:hypothetical protein ECANGB1_738 [Enterospora canceri]
MDRKSRNKIAIIYTVVMGLIILAIAAALGIYYGNNKSKYNKFKEEKAAKPPKKIKYKYFIPEDEIERTNMLFNLRELKLEELADKLQQLDPNEYLKKNFDKISKEAREVVKTKLKNNEIHLTGMVLFNIQLIYFHLHGYNLLETGFSYDDYANKGKLDVLSRDPALWYIFPLDENSTLQPEKLIMEFTYNMLCKETTILVDHAVPICSEFEKGLSRLTADPEVGDDWYNHKEYVYNMFKIIRVEKFFRKFEKGNTHLNKYRTYLTTHQERVLTNNVYYKQKDKIAATKSLVK